ncbi:hypothetical protein B0T21DRAFT_392306 [Apiosordaria backusii]|uniref:Uncharacterized protein n=1 Tax=Apiosordaria backusii TaxID=314023 RepID=A0AA40EEP8_9PEZI|nr:hypothetical protein B0T21DRAFT_392306 [Apiosordaria backusii]
MQPSASGRVHRKRKGFQPPFLPTGTGCPAQTPPKDSSDRPRWDANVARNTVARTAILLSESALHKRIKMILRARSKNETPSEDFSESPEHVFFAEKNTGEGKSCPSQWHSGRRREESSDGELCTEAGGSPGVWAVNSAIRYERVDPFWPVTSHNGEIAQSGPIGRRSANLVPASDNHRQPSRTVMPSAPSLSQQGYRD